MLKSMTDEDVCFTNRAAGRHGFILTQPVLVEASQKGKAKLQNSLSELFCTFYIMQSDISANIQKK